MAVDPFEIETMPSHEIIRELQNWSEQIKMTIQPVYLLETGDLKRPEISTSIAGEIEVSKNAVANYIHQLGLKNVRDPEIIVDNAASLSESVDPLLRYAETLQADWIMVSSKGRSGLQRLAFGSFAESLLTKSPIPVLVLGRGDSEHFDVKKIFFATDFSEFSRKIYLRFLRQAKQLKAQITLYHAVTRPEAMMVGTGLEPITPVGPFVDELARAQSDIAREWLAQAQLAGVLCDFIVETVVVGNIPDHILKAAQDRGCGMIAMASQSGPIQAALLGSHVRQVVRKSECPVWVFGPNCH